MLACVSFSDDFLFTAYGDGLILAWQCDFSISAGQRHSEEKQLDAKLWKALIGHTNKITALEPIMGSKRLYSCSNDCTIRQWDTVQGICELIYQFEDPIYCALYDKTREMLFTGGWDRQIRAIDLKDGIVDQSFGASKEAIRTLHLSGKVLYMAG